MDLQAFKPAKGLIFDLDGTLVDSRLDFDLMRQEIGIPKGLPILEYLEQSLDSALIKKGYEVVHRHELEGAKRATLMPGVIELLMELKRKEIPMGVLTRNSREVTELTLNRLSLPIDEVLTRDDCLPKPHPEGLLKFAKNWNKRPDELAYVGDFLFDYQTAKAAGMAFYYYQGMSQRSDELHKLADITISCYDNFSRIFFGML